MDDEDQVENSPEEHTEREAMIRVEEQKPIQLKRVFLEGDHREEIISTMAEDEVQIIPLPVSTQQVPSFIKNLQNSTPNYDKFGPKRHHSSIGTPLKCNKHPFLKDLSDIFEEIRTFDDNISSVEGDIFEDCSFDWALMKK